MIDVAQITVLVFGVSIVLLSTAGLYAPGKLLAQITSVMSQRWGILFAVLVRIVLGAALITSAVKSPLPKSFLVLGWLTIISAVGVMLMGSDRMQRFIAWFERRSMVSIRIWLLFGIAFGGMLIYGAA